MEYLNIVKAIKRKYTVNIILNRQKKSYMEYPNIVKAIKRKDTINIILNGQKKSNLTKIGKKTTLSSLPTIVTLP